MVFILRSIQSIHVKTVHESQSNPNDFSPERAASRTMKNRWGMKEIVRSMEDINRLVV